MILAALRLPLRLLPARLPAAAGAHLLNLALAGQPLKARLGELEGRTICLGIRDTGARLHFRIGPGGTVAAAPGPSQVTIYGELRDFIDLATRAEDPDTLFFHRRLCLEGDTETGLHVKNLLDALDYDWEARLRALLPAPLAGLGIGIARRLRPARRA